MNSFPAIEIKSREREKEENKNKLLVVIPGRIDIRRGDYDWIEKIPTDLSSKIDIVLLGKARTENDMNYIKALSDKGFVQTIKSVGQLIEKRIFDNYINSADILFVPFRELNHKLRKFDSNLGPYFDSIRFGKPLIIPSSSPCPPEIKKSTIPNKSTAVSSILLIWKVLSVAYCPPGSVAITSALLDVLMDMKDIKSNVIEIYFEYNLCIIIP